MEDQYGMADLRQYMTGRPLFPPIPPPSPDLLSGHRSLTPAQHYHEMVLVGRQVSHDMVPPGGSGLHHEFRADSAAVATTASLSGAVGFSGFEMETCSGLGTDGGTGRWPRQETLTLLEIRSRLDPKFKEANQKGPLWDEVSRIMSEEHGYQRSGKKCREKFENLYKYYKKTKEGKAGRQDGKHYRFFRQLEALYGESSNNAAASVSENNNHLVGSSYRYNNNIGGNNASGVSNQEPFQLAPKPSDSLSLSNSSDFNSTSSEDSDLNVTMDNHSNDRRRKRKGRKSWKAKIKDFIDSQMRKIMEKQEAWLEKMMRAIEEKEQERVVREEAWRKQEVDRIDREHKFWANERAWIEARDATLMETLRKLTGKEIIKATPPWENQNDNNGNETMSSLLKSDSWSEIETTRLIQLRTSMEPRFQRIGSCPEQVLWEEIAAKMACLGYDRNALMCKDKWDSISNYLIKCTKKRKENSRLCCYLTNGSINSQGGGTYSSDTTDQGPETMRNAQNDQGASPPNSDTGNAIHDGSYRFLIGDSTENLWENYGMKFSKGENH